MKAADVAAREVAVEASPRRFSMMAIKTVVAGALGEGYVINTVSERMAAQVQVCSQSFPRSVGKVAEVGFHTLPSTPVRPSRIAEPPVDFECRLHRTAEFGHEGSRTHLIVGEILAVHCAEGVVSGNPVSHRAINALGRIAGRSYCRTEDKFDV
jgi:flavin reductase (DIM6/NTAB) family NADH-FMN oxidoreductase RutF